MNYWLLALNKSFQIKQSVSVLCFIYVSSVINLSCSFEENLILNARAPFRIALIHSLLMLEMGLPVQINSICASMATSR